jgi:two-component system, LytTR family, response regulator
MALEVIERYCAKGNLVELKAVFREPVKAIEWLGRERVDLILLDINMPDISGMQLVQTLSPRPLVIFMTAYSHYAVESYTLNAIDYLLKPITFDRFLAAVNKAVAAVGGGPGVVAGAGVAAMTAVAGGAGVVTGAGGAGGLGVAGAGMGGKSGGTGNNEDLTIFIKSGPQTHQVKVSDILYLEKDGNYITAHLKDRNILIRENMGDVFDLVPAADFIRVHKSYIVAIKHIAMIEVHQLTVNNEKIPIGSTYRESLRARLGIN